MPTIFDVLDPTEELGIGALHAALGMHLTIAVLLWIRSKAPHFEAMQYGYPTFRGLRIPEDVTWDIRLYMATFMGVQFWKFLRSVGIGRPERQDVRVFMRLPLVQMDRIIAALMAIVFVNRAQLLEWPPAWAPTPRSRWGPGAANAA